MLKPNKRMYLQSSHLSALSSKEILRSKANDIAQLRKGSSPVTLDMKTFNAFSWCRFCSI